MNGVISGLSLRFSLKDLSTLNYFLGVQVQHHNTGLYLSRSKYIADLLYDTNMVSSHGVATLMTSVTSLFQNLGSSIHENNYRCIIGKIQYLSFMYPEIAYVVNRLSQFIHKPMEVHW